MTGVREKRTASLALATAVGIHAVLAAVIMRFDEGQTSLAPAAERGTEIEVSPLAEVPLPTASGTASAEGEGGGPLPAASSVERRTALTLALPRKRERGADARGKGLDAAPVVTANDSAIPTTAAGSTTLTSQASDAAQPGRSPPLSPPPGGGGSGTAAASGNDNDNGFRGAASGDGAIGPLLLHQVDSESVYPPQARRLGIEGTIEAILEIDGQGRVVSVKIAKPAGHGFDEAAANALRQFRFKPAKTSDGRPVASRANWKYTFLLKD